MSVTSKRYITEPSRQIEVFDEADVVVIGGGPSGIGAAIGAARQNAKTVLIEQQPFLGGAATGAAMNVWNVPVDRITGTAKEFAVDLAERGQAKLGSIISFDVEGFKELAFDKVLGSGAQLLTHVHGVQPIVENGAVKGIIFESKGGRQAIPSKAVIDCTGDADIAFRAGAATARGRETDHKMRPISLLFQIAGVDFAKVMAYVATHPEDFAPDPHYTVVEPDKGVLRLMGFYSLVRTYGPEYGLDPVIHYLRFEGIDLAHGVTGVNSTRIYNVDGTDPRDLTHSYIESRKQIRPLLKLIQDRVPGCENAFMVATAATLGVRETRRIVGSFVLNEDHIGNKTTYDDSIAMVWRHHAIGRGDPHPADPTEGAGGDKAHRKSVSELNWFQVPFRALVPNKLSGLLAAGRCISQTHDADMWTRGQFCCMVTGQAAGVAAAVSAEKNCDFETIDVKDVQKKLASQGVDIGAKN